MPPGMTRSFGTDVNLKKQTKNRLTTALYQMAWAFGFLNSLCCMPSAQAVHTVPVVSLAETAGRNRFDGPFWSNGTLPPIFDSFGVDFTCHIPPLYATGPNQGLHGRADSSAAQWPWQLCCADAGAAEAAAAAAANEGADSFRYMLGNQSCNVSGIQCRLDWEDQIDNKGPFQTDCASRWFLLITVWGIVLFFSLFNKTQLFATFWGLMLGFC